MSKVIKLRKGLDINLVGAAERVLTKCPAAASYALVPDHYRGVTPKLLVKVGDKVKAGSPLFFSKENPEVLFTSPVSGEVSAVNRGDKRKILSVVVTPDGQNQSENFDVCPLAELTRDRVKETMLRAGFWPMLIQRPFGIIAKTDATPKAIFISGLDTAPLAPDLNFLVQDQGEHIIAGLEVLKKLTDGKVHLTVGTDTTAGVLSRIKQAEVHHIEGPHPAGNVGVQIAQIDPINKGDVVWTVELQHVAMIGRLFQTGAVDMSKVVALTGSEVVKPHYFKVVSGALITSITDGNLRPKTPREERGVRVISGNPLTGLKVEPNEVEGYLGFYHNQITVIPEGNKYEFLGWAMPRLNKFSVSHSYFSWLTPKKKYNLDTNLNGGPRAFVQTGIYDKVLPMNIYPLYLIKAIMAGDIDKMENLGIYEILEEDVALCEFIDPSKNEWQATVSQGIELMIKELN
ncbi:MAG: Na(+)-translocating NADH-quinone reductase subunit A [Rikenellaceae bacterium]|nr:Na(+)-translocating NADH-quinone reductase subunit A [Rikenellaceae bacterium]